jgi:ubiquinone/menaquinone biosynthesis C-methylase UbiE
VDININKWLNKEGLNLLKKIGIKENQIVLDFGCGSGNYTIPAAKIIGKKGKVYAVDEDGFKLKQLAERAELDGLNNIEIRKTSGELKFGFEDGTLDVVLLYDIFWYFSFQNSRLSELLKEVYRILRPGAIISIYPEHIEIEELKQVIERYGFSLENIFREQVVHEGILKVGQILNFRK